MCEEVNQGRFSLQHATQRWQQRCQISCRIRHTLQCIRCISKQNQNSFNFRSNTTRRFIVRHKTKLFYKSIHDKITSWSRQPTKVLFRLVLEQTLSNVDKRPNSSGLRKNWQNIPEKRARKRANREKSESHWYRNSLSKDLVSPKMGSKLFRKRLHNELMNTE